METPIDLAVLNFLQSGQQSDRSLKTVSKRLSISDYDDDPKPGGGLNMADNVRENLWPTEPFVGRSDTMVMPGDDSEDLRAAGWQVVMPDLHQSTVKTLCQCHRMFLLKERMGIVPRGAGMAAFRGTIFHLFMHGRFAGRSDAETEGVVAERVNENLLSMEQTARLSGWTPDILHEQEGKLRQLVAVARTMARVSWSRNQFKRCRVLGSEIGFKVQLDWLKQPLAGIIDLLVQIEDGPMSGHLFIVDHKTTELAPKMLIATLGASLQSRVYRLAAEALPAAEGRRVTGFVLNVVRVPTIRQKVRSQEQTIDDYAAECYEWYTGTGRHERRQSKVLAEPPMEQGVSIYTEGRVPDDLRTMLLTADRASRALPVLRNYALTGEAADRCMPRWGLCPYHRLCFEVPPEEWPREIESGRYSVNFGCDLNDVLEQGDPSAGE